MHRIFPWGKPKLKFAQPQGGGRQAWTKIQNRHPSKIVKENWQILVNKDFTLPPEQVQRGQRQTHLPPVHATGGQKYNRLGLGASSRLLSSPFPYNRWEMYNVFVYIFFNSGSQGKGGGDVKKKMSCQLPLNHCSKASQNHLPKKYFF